MLEKNGGRGVTLGAKDKGWNNLVAFTDNPPWPTLSVVTMLWFSLSNGVDRGVEMADCDKLKRVLEEEKAEEAARIPCSGIFMLWWRGLWVCKVWWEWWGWVVNNLNCGSDRGNVSGEDDAVCCCCCCSCCSSMLMCSTKHRQLSFNCSISASCAVALVNISCRCCCHCVCHCSCSDNNIRTLSSFSRTSVCNAEKQE